MEEESNQPKKGILRHKSEDKHQYVSVAITILPCNIFDIVNISFSGRYISRFICRIPDQLHARVENLTRTHNTNTLLNFPQIVDLE